MFSRRHIISFLSTIPFFGFFGFVRKTNRNVLEFCPTCNKEYKDRKEYIPITTHKHTTSEGTCQRKAMGCPHGHPFQWTYDYHMKFMLFAEKQGYNVFYVNKYLS